MPRSQYPALCRARVRAARRDAHSLRHHAAGARRPAGRRPAPGAVSARRPAGHPVARPRARQARPPRAARSDAGNPAGLSAGAAAHRRRGVERDAGAPDPEAGNRAIGGARRRGAAHRCARLHGGVPISRRTGSTKIRSTTPRSASPRSRRCPPARPWSRPPAKTGTGRAY